MAFKTILLCGFLAWHTLWPGSASAQKINSFGIPVNSALLSGETSVTITGVALLAAGPSTLTINFVLPRDYVNDSEVEVLLSMRATSASCSFLFEALSMQRVRAGRAPTSGLAGLTAPGPVITAPAPQVVFLKKYRINPGGAMPGQRKSDSISLMFRRVPDDPLDTCVTQALIIPAIEVRYTAE